MNSNYYAIIMAGGIGSRFWPVSTAEYPKQFHDMLGAGQTLIQRTFQRFSKIVPAENILILTNVMYRDIVVQQLPMLAPEQILLEPAMRNTAPCILYATLKIRKMNPNAVMVVAPSDHWIEDENAFAADLEKSFEFCANNDALVTLGIKPTFPNTGFGYIEFDTSSSSPVKAVKRFTEKPDYETAKRFYDSGNFLWNGGIFIWNSESILEAFKKFRPQMLELFMSGYEDLNTDREQDFLASHYHQAERVSIDYAVMESAANVYVVPAAFDWNDLGTWGSLHEKLPKDEHHNAIVNARPFLENASGNIIRTGKDKLVVVDGLHDFIIVDEGDTLLIYPKDKEQNIKAIVNSLTFN